jgi:carboxynorspermidine decarboxylase
VNQSGGLIGGLGSLEVAALPSPCFVVDQEALEHNLGVLDQVQRQTGAKILLALKGFAMFSVFPLLNKVLVGTCASSVDEARLGREEFGGQVHTFSPAYSRENIETILSFSDHLVFNSLSQWRMFRDICGRYRHRVQFGLRINPQHSEVETALYDPCAPCSRLGIRADDLEGADLDGITGLHFHSLCERDSYALERTLQVVEERFSKYFTNIKWVNWGGGHHITRPDYDVAHLIALIRLFKKKYDVDLYLEPGEAVALNAGVFVAQVLDVVNNEIDIAILDASASTHLPDVLEMPYRPVIVGAGKAGEKAHTYRLGGISCLAGDIIGDYSFDRPLQIGARLIFTDMAHYTMVKTTTFNGVRLPSIVLHNRGEIRVVRKFGYEDFKGRLS